MDHSERSKSFEKTLQLKVHSEFKKKKFKIEL